jgi:hypothetical protein
MWVVLNGQNLHGHGLWQLGGWMDLLQPFFHEIKVSKPFDYALGSCCVDVCTWVLLIGNLPILHSNMRLEWWPSALCNGGLNIFLVCHVISSSHWFYKQFILCFIWLLNVISTCWLYANIVSNYWRNLECLLKPFFARFGPMLHILCFYVSMGVSTDSGCQWWWCGITFIAIFFFLLQHFFWRTSFVPYGTFLLYKSLHCSLGQFFGTRHLVFFSLGRFLPKGNLKILFKCLMFFIIHFIWWQKQLGKGLNPRPLGWRKNLNHCITFFSLKLLCKKYTYNLNHCVGTIKKI